MALFGVPLVLAVIAWLVVPPITKSTTASTGPGGTATGGGPSGAIGGGQATVSTSAPGTHGTGDTGGASGTAGGTAAAAGSASAGGVGNVGSGSGDTGASASSEKCASSEASNQGVTTSQVKVAIVVIQVVGPAGNSVANLPPPSQQQQDFQEVADNINASGGAACRKLVPVFYTANPVDQSNLHQTCLDIVQAAPFAVLDVGAYALNSATADCYPQNGIPYFGNPLPPASQVSGDYPYFFSPRPTMEVLYRNTVFALDQRGFFKPATGFRKIGIIYRDCVPAVVGETEGWLHQIGLSSAQIVAYDMGCSSAIYAPPTDVEAAVLKFEQAGVTNVTEINDFSDLDNFTDVSQQQNFHPRYGIPNDNSITGTTSSPHADYNNLANAVAVTALREGEETTPGYVPSAGTARCNAIYKSHAQPTVYQQANVSGDACSLLWMLTAAIDHAPSLQRAALAAGLQAAKAVDLSYPEGPNNFTGYHVTTGGEDWRIDQFFTRCDCWQVVDDTFHPSFS